MTRFASALPLLAFLVAAAPLAAPAHAQAARDFQLPPAPTPTQDTRVQGPVDTDAPVPVRPRAIETGRPTPAPAATPTPTASTAPAIVLPSATATSPNAARPTPTRTVPAQPTPTVAPALPPASVPGAAASAAPLVLPTTSAPSAVPSSAIPPPPATAAGETPLPWLWIVLGGAALAAGAAGLFLWRRRSAPVSPPTIIVPHVPAPASPSEAGAALAIAIEAVRLDRSVMNATVGYRVTVRNRTSQALSDVAVEADLVSAGGDRPAEQQLASPEQALTPRHAAGRLAPGQSMRFEGQVRLPLSEASAIWQGRVGLLVPLLRARVTASGAAPVATTLVIGRSEGQASRPQPFRLDEPPRSYAPLAQRVLDAVPARA